MWIRLLIVSMGMWSINTSAQYNLVPNPGFEIFDTCPDWEGQIKRAVPWFQPYTPLSSSDYFNSCDIGIYSSIPQNFAGEQSARTGSAYVGISMGYFNGNNVREYIEIELIDTLEAGKKYCISFFVSCGDYSKRACDAMGAYFSTLPLTYNSPPWGLLSLNAQIENIVGNIITDTVGWVEVIDSFIAQGGEKFMTIGNFKSDINTNWITINANAIHLYSYYYIDDVSVTLCDRIIGIKQFKEEDLRFSPNPTNEIIRINIPNEFQEKAVIKIYSVMGELVFIKTFRNDINIEYLSNGIYFLSIESQYGNVIKKFVKI